jgi:hypothetical protein
VTLREAIECLAELDDEATIYVQGASESWIPESDAGVGVEDLETEFERLPPEAEGRTYFLEVSVTKEILSGWASNLDHTPTLDESVERVIRYARYDA